MADQLDSGRAQEQPALVDTRILEFGHKTIVAALQGVGVKMLNLPAGVAIRHLSFDAKANAFKAIYGNGFEQMVDASLLAAVMIAYCISAGLPIPRSANKSVRISEQGLTLRFTTTLPTPPQAKAA